MVTRLESTLYLEPESNLANVIHISTTTPSIFQTKVKFNSVSTEFQHWWDHLTPALPQTLKRTNLRTRNNYTYNLIDARSTQFFFAFTPPENWRKNVIRSNNWRKFASIIAALGQSCDSVLKIVAIFFNEELTRAILLTNYWLKSPSE